MRKRMRRAVIAAALSEDSDFFVSAMNAAVGCALAFVWCVSRM